jgi:hypothetical protein
MRSQGGKVKNGACCARWRSDIQLTLAAEAGASPMGVILVSRHAKTGTHKRNRCRQIGEVGSLSWSLGAYGSRLSASLRPG